MFSFAGNLFHQLQVFLAHLELLSCLFLLTHEVNDRVENGVCVEGGQKDVVPLRGRRELLANVCYYKVWKCSQACCILVLALQVTCR